MTKSAIPSLSAASRLSGGIMAGGTLLKIGNKYKNIRFDVGSKSLFHMNIKLTKTANYHLPIGVFGAGLWGGVMRD